MPETRLEPDPQTGTLRFRRHPHVGMDLVLLCLSEKSTLFAVSYILDVPVSTLQGALEELAFHLQTLHLQKPPVTQSAPQSALALITRAYDGAGIRHVVRQDASPSGYGFFYLFLAGTEEDQKRILAMPLEQAQRELGFLEFTAEGRVASY